MYYVSSKKKTGKTRQTISKDMRVVNVTEYLYGVTDTKDNVEEFVTFSQIVDYVEAGVDIKGVRKVTKNKQHKNLITYKIDVYNAETQARMDAEADMED